MDNRRTREHITKQLTEKVVMKAMVREKSGDNYKQGGKRASIKGTLPFDQSVKNLCIGLFLGMAIPNAILPLSITPQQYSLKQTF